MFLSVFPQLLTDTKLVCELLSPPLVTDEYEFVIAPSSKTVSTDAERWKETFNALKVIGLGDDEKQQIFAVSAAVMWRLQLKYTKSVSISLKGHYEPTVYLLTNIQYYRLLEKNCSSFYWLSFASATSILPQSKMMKTPVTSLMTVASNRK